MTCVSAFTEYSLLFAACEKICTDEFSDVTTSLPACAQYEEDYQPNTRCKNTACSGAMINIINQVHDIAAGLATCAGIYASFATFDKDYLVVDMLPHMYQVRAGGAREERKDGGGAKEPKTREVANTADVAFSPRCAVRER